MCWHRHAPHPAFLKPPPVLTVYHDLRPVRCYKTQGFIVPLSDSYYCPKCYCELRIVNNIRFNYEHFNLHFLVDGLQEVFLTCWYCELNLLNAQPIGRCAICTREHLNLLTNARQTENPFFDNQMAVISHSGQDFLLKEDWSLFIIPA